MRTEFFNIGESLEKLRLVWTVTAEFKIHISCRADDSGCNFQQLESDSVDTILSHGLRQCQAAEPVKEIVCECMNLNPVGVNNHGRTADIAHIEAGFALLDEVFHFSPLAVKAD